MRLDKLLAHTGFGSRKDVRKIIRKGRVRINEEVVKDQGKHLNYEKDIVTVDGERVHYRPYIYLMLNKPQGFISATKDAYHQTVIDLLADEYKVFEPFPVGRLDKDTEGLLLLTNDGKLAHQLTSPRKEIKKTYYVEVKGKVTSSDQIAFQKGIVLDDGYITKPAELFIHESKGISKVELMLTEGKFHQVKRMFASRGKEVIYLKRTKMGAITLDEKLALGEYRELNDLEMKYCKELTASSA